MLVGDSLGLEDAMQQAVHKYLKALEAGDAEKAASLFVCGRLSIISTIGR
jgi:hypothetical protein